MGWAKKTVKKVTKSVKKVAKSVTKVVKSVTKPIVKVVKKVAKSIVNVGKKVFSGIKSAVKSVGKTLGKLGPLASMAMMAIPGLQPFAAGMWSSMGVTGALAQQALTSAAVSFVTSGGDLKAAVIGGVGAYAGGALMGGAKAAWNGGSFAEGVSGAVNQAGVSSFQAGMDAASKSWGNFTNNVSEFFGANSPTGDITQGTEAFVGTYEKYGMSPQEYVDTYNKIPDTIGVSGAMSEQQKMLYEQDLGLFDEAVTPKGVPDYMKQDWTRTMNEMGIDPAGEQAAMLAEQEFGGVADMTKTATGDWNYSAYNQDLALSIDPVTGQYDPSSMLMTAQSGVGGTPTYIGAPTVESSTKKKDLSSLLDSTTPGVGAQPFVFNDPGKGISLTSAGGGAGGTGGALGFTQQQRELQARLISQAEAQAEAARKRAQGGWGLV
mgnify:CR=1 FL=1